MDGETVDRPARGSIPRPYVLARAARQLEIVNDPGDEWPNAWTERGKEPDCRLVLWAADRAQWC